MAARQHALRALRPVQMQLGFHSMSEGSVLYRAGRTLVLVTASIDDGVPEFMRGSGKGWLTAEYQMHPRANPNRREGREGRGRSVSGRTQEIQRLIGRSLRCALSLSKMGERTLSIDADVLEADGGTRTASITAGFVAVAAALWNLRQSGKLLQPIVRDQIAAVSVGHVGGEHCLDLCYAEDSSARVDLTVVATAQGRMVEVQGTAEGEAVDRSEVDAMIDLALEGVGQLAVLQQETLKQAGVELGALMVGKVAQ